MTLKEKLLKIQNTLIAPKDLTNKFGNYKYRSAEGILEAVKPLCKANNCLIILGDDLVNIGDRYYIKATATLADVNSDDTITSSSFAREEESKKGMDGSQITGAFIICP